MVTRIESGKRVDDPQLREAMTWLATMRTDLFDALGEDDPGALLASDVGVHGTHRRAKLVASLIAAIEGGLEHDVSACGISAGTITNCCTHNWPTN